MATSSAPTPGPPGTAPDGERLDSWKEIAGYLGRTVRTVQRWERTEGLPVHRLRLDRQGSVYALRAELDAWWRTRQASPPPTTEAEAAAPGRRGWAAGVAAVVLAAAAATWLLRPGPDPPPARAPARVAVLPFQALSGEQLLGDGVTEDLIGELARLEGLSVVARSSVAGYRDQPQPLARIAAELQVSHVIEGAVQAAGEHLKLSARLIRVSDQVPLWSMAETLTPGELPRVERALALRVAAALIAVPPRGAAADAPVVSPAAYEAFLRRREQLRLRSAPGFDAAEQALLEATRLAPDFARAWAALADCYALMSNYGARPTGEAQRAARDAVQRALALDPELGEAHAALAFQLRNHDWDFGAAEREFRRALELSPGDVQAWTWYALHLSTLGRFDEARRALERARELDPLNPRGLDQLAALALRSRRWQEAIDRYRAILQLDLDHVNAHLDIGRALAQTGAWDEAIRKLERCVELLGGDPMAVAVLGNVLARAGRGDEARAQLARLEAMRPSATWARTCSRCCWRASASARPRSTPWSRCAPSATSGRSRSRPSPSWTSCARSRASPRWSRGWAGPEWRTRGTGRVEPQRRCRRSRAFERGGARTGSRREP